jgi:hypothetical protein
MTATTDTAIKVFIFSTPDCLCLLDEVKETLDIGTSKIGALFYAFNANYARIRPNLLEIGYNGVISSAEAAQFAVRPQMNEAPRRCRRGAEVVGANNLCRRNSSVCQC